MDIKKEKGEKTAKAKRPPLWATMCVDNHVCGRPGLFRRLRLGVSPDSSMTLMMATWFESNLV